MANKVIVLERNRTTRTAEQWLVLYFLDIPVASRVTVGGQNVAPHLAIELPDLVMKHGLLSVPETDAIDAGEALWFIDTIKRNPTVETISELTTRVQTLLIQRAPIEVAAFKKRFGSTGITIEET